MSLKVQDIFNVSGKNAVVTGGTRGIGYMIASGLISNGANVFISARSKDQCDEAEKKLNDLGPGKCVAFSVDLSTDEGCKDLVAKISAHTDTIHVLVNNAGALQIGKLEEFPAEAWKASMAINVEAPFNLTRALLPHLRKSVDADTRGVVINISSIAAKENNNGHGMYSYASSKSGLDTLTRILADELSTQGINVNAISPGLFPSAMTQFALDIPAIKEKALSGIPVGRAGTPPDIAGLVLYMASRAGQFLTGANIPLNGGQLIKGNSGP